MPTLLQIPDAGRKIRRQHGFTEDFPFLDLREQSGFLDIPIGAWAEQSGAALADFSNGVSNTPGWNAGDESFGIRWNNAAAPDPISMSVPVPPDLDASRDVVIHVLAAKVGATDDAANTVTWLIEAFFNVGGALYDADSDAGGTSSAMTPGASTKTVQEETLTIAAANVEASPATLTITLQPTDGTLDDDDVIVTGVWLEYTSTESSNSPWALIADSGGSAAVSDGVSGKMSIVTDGDDNDEAYLFNTIELFKIAADKPIEAEFLIQYTEAATDAANIIVGIMSAVAADALQDNGAGPAADYSGALFFKQDGETLWSVENSVSTTQKTTQLTTANSLDKQDHTAGTTSDFQTLRIEMDPKSATLYDVTFWIDGVLVAKHIDQVFTGFTDAAIVVGCKAGGGNAETLVVDYINPWQLR
jgi:hypothetical protein